MRQKEFERARAIFKAGLERVVKDRAEDLYQKYVNFEKIYGGQQQIEDVVMQKRRYLYVFTSELRRPCGTPGSVLYEKSHCM